MFTYPKESVLIVSHDKSSTIKIDNEMNMKTDELLNKLRRINSIKSCETMARDIGVSMHTVIRWLNKLNIPSARALEKIKIYIEENEGNIPEKEILKYKDGYTDEQKTEIKMKNDARKETRDAISSGILTRQPCEICGNERVEMHHNDYKNPLDIRWLCKTHHVKHHRSEERKARNVDE